MKMKISSRKLKIILKFFIFIFYNSKLLDPISIMHLLNADVLVHYDTS